MISYILYYKGTFSLGSLLFPYIWKLHFHTYIVDYKINEIWNAFVSSDNSSKYYKLCGETETTEVLG